MKEHIRDNHLNAIYENMAMPIATNVPTATTAPDPKKNNIGAVSLTTPYSFTLAPTTTPTYSTITDINGTQLLVQNLTWDPNNPTGTATAVTTVATAPGGQTVTPIYTSLATPQAPVMSFPTLVQQNPGDTPMLLPPQQQPPQVQIPNPQSLFEVKPDDVTAAGKQVSIEIIDLAAEKRSPQVPKENLVEIAMQEISDFDVCALPSVQGEGETNQSEKERVEPVEEEVSPCKDVGNVKNVAEKGKMVCQKCGKDSFKYLHLFKVHQRHCTR